MPEVARKSIIITFRPKDQRPDKQKDKLQIVRGMITSEVSFIDAGAMAREAGLPAGLPTEMVGYDVNLYEAPIAVASLTEAEIDALKKNGNVAAVEDDGPCYALELKEELVIEGQPTPLAETIPAGVAQIKAPAAWDCSRGKAIKVAVLDTGIDGTHPDLAPNYKGGVSFVPGEASPMDFNGHGTSALGKSSPLPLGRSDPDQERCLETIIEIWNQHHPRRRREGVRGGVSRQAPGLSPA